MRLIGAFIRFKSKLEDLHTRKTGLLQECTHIIGDISEVFRDQGQIRTEVFAEGMKEGDAGTLLPMSGPRVLTSCRDSPVGFETAEVIEPQYIKMLQLMPDPPDPPVEQFVPVPGPVVEWVVPHLSLFGKIIRRDTGHGSKRSVFIHLKEFRMHPGDH